MTPALSVVIPVRDEAPSVLPLLASVHRVLRGLARPYEVLLVDDGSTDDGVARLKSAGDAVAPLKIVVLDGGQGQSVALQAGFDAAQGEILVSLDGDGQNDPQDIPLLLAKLDEGCDVVCGWRHRREDPWSRKIASRLANAVRRRFTGERIHDVGCTLRAFRRPVLEKVHLSGGLHRMFTALAARYGFRVEEVMVAHHPRRAGRSKYGNVGRLIEGTADLLTVLTLDAGRPMPRTPAPLVREMIVL